MTDIVPRWEWRTFGPRFAGADGRFAEMAQTGVQESDELYFLVEVGGAIVKVRDDLMDVKLLRDVDVNGLERWEPVMKAAFPVSAADVAMVCKSLGLTTPALKREAYSLDQFIAELAMPGGVRAVRVHKHRVRYLVGGCTAELSDVLADGKSARTIAIEATDPVAVAAAVASVGLGGFVNTNYPRGLQALLDGTPERYAVIDVGTNSVKLHVAERDEEEAWRAVADRAELTRLGEGLEAGGQITPEAGDRTADAIDSMAREARSLQARAIVAVGTAGLRAAGNSAAVLEMVRAKTGVSVEVISGDDESRLAYRAAASGLHTPEGPRVVFDTGGGSTQFTFGRGDQVEERFSVPVGAARLTEQFGLAGAVSPEVLCDAFAAISAELSRIDGRPPPDTLVAMGGAVTNLAAVKLALAAYDPEVIQGQVLDRAEVDRQIEMYRTRDAAARGLIIGLQPKRADVILAGACIVRTVMDKLGAASLTVSDRGLRHGVLIERFGA